MCWRWLEETAAWAMMSQQPAIASFQTAELQRLTARLIHEIDSTGSWLPI